MYREDPARSLREPLWSDHRRSRAPCRYGSRVADRAGLRALWGGSAVRRRQGRPRRAGAVAGVAGGRRTGSRHHQCHRARSLGRREGGRRRPGRTHFGDREGRESGCAGRHHPGLEIGASTEIIAGEHRILTAGGIDSHIHFISPQQAWEALYSGVTTMIGGGTGPAEGTRATTCTPGEWHIHRMIEATDDLPLNFGFLGKGNASGTGPLIEQVCAGAMGLKLHEDWGTTPATIEAALTVADEYDVQVAIHTDTLNESGFVEDTLAAIGGRTIHTYHSEGAGGGHAPDILKVCAHPNVLPSSTNPTMPFTVNTLDEHLDMLLVCHHLNAQVPEDVAFAESRIRPETMAAEDVLHDIGAISMMSSDSQAMGRVGEVIVRTWQTAHVMKAARGAGAGDPPEHDNHRIRRYLAKYTINPARAHGISEYVGSIEPGKYADLVLWSPMFFGVKPDLVIKGGFIAAALMGDPNASIPTPEPVRYRPMFAALGRATGAVAWTFVSQASMDQRRVPARRPPPLPPRPA